MDSTGVGFYPLTVAEGVRCYVALAPRAADPISAGIAAQVYAYPPGHRLLFGLMRPGDTVVDLGAHVGSFALAAAALGCRVLAIEAAPDNVALLRAGVERNGFGAVRVVAAAAGEHVGSVAFVPDGPYGGVAGPYPSALPSIDVRAETLDHLVDELGWDRIDFIKMDVEGSEVAALLGMRRLLAPPAAPALLYEANGYRLRLLGQTPQRLKAEVEALGYASYLVEHQRLVPVSPEDLQAECVADYLATRRPPEHSGAWPVLPRSPEETIAKVIESGTRPDEAERAYIAGALAGAGEAILSEPRVLACLESLSADPSAAVRAAASWFRREPAGETS